MFAHGVVKWAIRLRWPAPPRPRRRRRRRCGSGAARRAGTALGEVRDRGAVLGHLLSIVPWSRTALRRVGGGHPGEQPVQRVRVADLTLDGAMSTGRPVGRRRTHPDRRDRLAQLDGWWRRQLPVRRPDLPVDNPLLRQVMSRDDVKPRLLGHWGTTPGLNFLYAHPQPGDAERSQSTICHRPGHGGGPAWSPAPIWTAPTPVYPTSPRTPRASADCSGKFSFPGGIPSHVAPETLQFHPRGRRVGLRAVTRHGAFRQPRPAAGRRKVGDGEAETGALATSWHPTVRQRRPGRRGAADPAPQRLQDRESDGAGPDPTDEPRSTHGRLRSQPVFCSGGPTRTRKTTPTPTAGSPPCSTRCSTRSPASRPAPPPQR